MPNKPHSALPAHMAAEAGPLKSSGTHGELSRSSERSSFDRPSARGKSTQEIIEELKAREDVGSREAFRLFDKDGDGIITKASDLGLAPHGPSSGCPLSPRKVMK